MLWSPRKKKSNMSDKSCDASRDFGTISTILKTWKTPIDECYFLVKLHASTLLKNITVSEVFFTFFKLYKWYQIAQIISYAVGIPLILLYR